MTWEEIAGNWTYYKGRFKERWGEITEDKDEILDGEVDQLIGSLQVRYGLTKEEVELELKKFFANRSVTSQIQAS